MSPLQPGNTSHLGTVSLTRQLRGELSGSSLPYQPYTGTAEQQWSITDSPTFQVTEGKTDTGGTARRWDVTDTFRPGTNDPLMTPPGTAENAGGAISGAPDVTDGTDVTVT